MVTARFLESQIRDLQHLEIIAVFLQRLGSYVKGTVLYVSADNLDAHSLAGYWSLSMLRNFADFIWLTVQIFSSMMSEVGL